MIIPDTTLLGYIVIVMFFSFGGQILLGYIVGVMFFGPGGVLKASLDEFVYVMFSLFICIFAINYTKMTLS